MGSRQAVQVGWVVVVGGGVGVGLMMELFSVSP
jgi:hypothetical protein